MDLSADQLQALQLIFDHFDREANWPAYRLMQRRFVREVAPTDLQDVLNGLPGSLRWCGYISPDQELTLPIARMVFCKGAQPILKSFARVMRYCSERDWESVEGDVVISSDTLQSELGLRPEEAIKIGRMLGVEPIRLKLLNHAADGTWSVTLGDDMHWYRGVVSIGDYMAVNERRFEERMQAGVGAETLIAPFQPPVMDSQDQSHRDTVFVVYGRDEEARKALFELLRSAGLRPLEWDQAVALTNKASPYAGEVIDVALRSAQAIVVLFTPDDYAVLRSDLVGSSRRDEGWQPRPNVILEAGMALGRSEDRTVLVELGELRGMSDLLGRHVVRMDDSVEKRKALLERLRTAGCLVDTTGHDWMKAGKFSRPPTDALISSVTPRNAERLSAVIGGLVKQGERLTEAVATLETADFMEWRMRSLDVLERDIGVDDSLTRSFGIEVLAATNHDLQKGVGILRALRRRLENTADSW